MSAFLAQYFETFWDPFELKLVGFFWASFGLLLGFSWASFEHLLSFFWASFELLLIFFWASFQLFARYIFKLLFCLWVFSTQRHLKLRIVLNTFRMLSLKNRSRVYHTHSIYKFVSSRDDWFGNTIRRLSPRPEKLFKLNSSENHAEASLHRSNLRRPVCLVSSQPCMGIGFIRVYIFASPI